MALTKAAQAAKNLIERGQQQQLEDGLPADRIKNQLPGRALPPATGSTRGGVTLSDSDPLPVGTADPGVSAAASRADHVHDGAPGSGTLNISDGVTTVMGVTDLAIDGGTVDDDGGGAATLHITGGGGSASGQLYLDVPPASPHALDDEFPGTTLDAKWSDISVGSGLQWATTVSGGWMLAEPAQSGSSSTSKYLMGLRQNAPLSSFSVMAKIADNKGGDDVREGVFVSDGTRFHVCGSNRANSTAAAAIGGNNYSETVDAGSYDGFYTSAGPASYPAIWCKIVWDAGTSTLSFYWSQSGMFWELISTRSSMNQPTRVGLAMWSQNTGSIAADHVLAVDWFRVTEP